MTVETFSELNVGDTFRFDMGFDAGEGNNLSRNIYKKISNDSYVYSYDNKHIDEFMAMDYWDVVKENG